MDKKKKEKLFDDYKYNKEESIANKALRSFKYKIKDLEKTMNRSLSISELKELIMKEMSFINVWSDILLNTEKSDILLRDSFKKIYKYYNYALPIIKGKTGKASKEEVVLYLIEKIKNEEV